MMKIFKAENHSLQRNLAASSHISTEGFNNRSIAAEPSPPLNNGLSNAFNTVESIPIALSLTKK
jgi:hypothetical protein